MQYENCDEETYIKIIQYYEISEKLLEEVINTDKISEHQKNEILIPIVSTVKETADFLIDSYVVFLKNKKNRNLKTTIMETLDKLLVEISVCKNKIYELYNS